MVLERPFPSLCDVLAIIWMLVLGFDIRPRARPCRAKGPETSQPRATPWVDVCDRSRALKGRHNRSGPALCRPFRACGFVGI